MRYHRHSFNDMSLDLTNKIILVMDATHVSRSRKDGVSKSVERIVKDPDVQGGDALLGSSFSEPKTFLRRDKQQKA